jgi:hypothetical protein
VCEEYLWQPIDFLSIDVGIYEREVIEGHDWNRWRPRIAIVEDGISSETSQTAHHE